MTEGSSRIYQQKKKKYFWLILKEAIWITYEGVEKKKSCGTEKVVSDSNS